MIFKTTQMKLWMRLQGKEIRGRSYFSMRKGIKLKFDSYVEIIV
jgi:hypothetical protein